MDSTLGVAILGAGCAGGNHAPALGAGPGTRLDAEESSRSGREVAVTPCG